MFASGDTIAAVATPVGAGGVGIVRISGPNAAAILASVTKRDEIKFRERYLEYGAVYREGVRVDEVLYVLMRGPRSFTGEDVAEIHGHGGAANMAELLRCVIEAGARHAGPGEFTRRAFENGRIDLTRAEAIADIVNASSARALRIAQEQLAGKLGAVLDRLIKQVIDITAEVEASIDFPEDDLSEQVFKNQSERANDAAQHCRELAESYGLGRVLGSGVDVVLRGAVNAGKSSLFNALVGRTRSIVAAEAGTTRDYVEAPVVWRGVALNLVDTAGIRAVEDRNEIEGAGIELGAERAELADVELWVDDGSEDSPAARAVSESRAAGKLAILIRSKCDRAEVGLVTHDAHRTSAKTGLGIEELKEKIVDLATGGHMEAAEGCVITNERQRSRFAAAAEHLGQSAVLLDQRAPAELIVVELNGARSQLAEICGDEVGDEMLDSLFSRFCIGK